MCVYDAPINQMSKSNADYKQVSDIKDAVNILNDERLKLNRTGKFN